MTPTHGLRSLHDLGAPERRRWRLGADALRAELREICEAESAGEARWDRLLMIDLPESAEAALREGLARGSPQLLRTARSMHGTMQLGFWRSDTAASLARGARSKLSSGDAELVEAMAGDASSLLATSKPHMRKRFGGRLVPVSDIPPRAHVMDRLVAAASQESSSADAYVIATGLRALRRLTRGADHGTVSRHEARLMLTRIDARLRGSGAVPSVQAALRQASAIEGWLGGEFRDWLVGAMDSLLVEGMGRQHLLLRLFSPLHVALAAPQAASIEATLWVADRGTVPFMLARKGISEAPLYRCDDLASAFRVLSTGVEVDGRALFALHVPTAEERAHLLEVAS